MRNSNKNGFKNEAVYNKKYLKTNSKSYRCKSKKKKDFYDDGIP